MADEPTRLLRCPWCPRHFVARRPDVDTASARFAVCRDAYELLVAHAASRHGRDRLQLQTELVARIAGTRKVPA